MQFKNLIPRQATSYYLKAGVALLGILLLAVGGWLARGDWHHSTQSQISGITNQELTGPTTVGQTFVASQAGLEAIEIRVNAFNRQNSQPIWLHLRAGPQDSTDLRRAMVSAAGLDDGDWAKFTFEPLPDSRQNYYYFFITSPTSVAGDAITVYYGPPDTYRAGALYLNGHPQEAQLAFRTVYNRWLMLADLIQSLIWAMPQTAAILLLLIGPGGAMLAWFWPNAEIDRFGWLALAAGISLALLPLLFLCSWLLHLTLSAALIWGLVILSLGLLAGRMRRVVLWQKLPVKEPALFNIAFVVILLLIIGVRLAIIRNLSIPFWGDSVQHAVIGQRMVEAGGLFRSWQPYAPFQTFTMHFGFHSLIASLFWLVGGEIPRLTLLAGQIVNIVAVAALYPLAVTLAGGRRWAGLGAMLIAGLLSPMPMYYLNWGRYPQLTGQAILPVALWLSIQALSKPPNSRRWLSASIVCAGLFLSYYRMPFFFALFIGVWLAINLRRETILSTGRTLLWMALVGGAVLLPWAIRLRQGRLAKLAVTQAHKTWTFERFLESLAPWQEITFFTGWLPLILTGLALLIGLLRYRREIIILPPLWFLLLTALSLFRLLPVPGAIFLDNFTIIIASYIPVALLGGWLIARMIQRLPWTKAGIVILLAIGIWGAKESVSRLEGNHQMVFRPDERAMAWIRQNTPEEALFFVDGFPVYQENSIVGADAGWWLPLLAKRKNTMPPQYAMIDEIAIDPDYRQDIVRLIVELQEEPLASERGRALLKQFGVTHIYLGQAQGKVNNSNPIIDPQALQQSPYFNPIYHQDRVWIFALPDGSEAK